MCVAYDNMDDMDRNELATSNEVSRNLDTMIALGEACLEAEERRQRRHSAAARPHRLDLGGAVPANESDRALKQRRMREQQLAEVGVGVGWGVGVVG